MTRLLMLLVLLSATSCAVARPEVQLLPDPHQAHQLAADQELLLYVKGSDGKLYPVRATLHRGAWCAEEVALPR